MFGSRSLRCSSMSSYYAHWEGELYRAVVKLTLSALDDYWTTVKDEARCSVKAVLRFTDILLEPDPASVVEGALMIVRGIIEGSKKFIRCYR